MCACKQQYVHSACLVKWIEANHFTSTCSVCKQIFQNVKIEKPKTTYKLNDIVKILAAIVLFGICEAVIAICLLQEMHGSLNPFYIFGIAVTSSTSALSFVTLLCVSVVLYERRVPLLVSSILSARISIETETREEEEAPLDDLDDLQA